MPKKTTKRSKKPNSGKRRKRRGYAMSLSSAKARASAGWRYMKQLAEIVQKGASKMHDAMVICETQFPGMHH